MKALHMVTADPVPHSTFTPLPIPNWFFLPLAVRLAPHRRLAPHSRADQPKLRWNHGDIQGRNRFDLGWLRRPRRPMTRALTAIPGPITLMFVYHPQSGRPSKDDYVMTARHRRDHDGKSRPSAISRSPPSARSRGIQQLNASFGRFAMGTLRASTKALAQRRGRPAPTFC